MTPGARGKNTIRFRIQDSAGAPVPLARLPTVSIRANGLDLGTVPVARAGAGTCTADVVIPTAGRVKVQIGMRRSQFENPRRHPDFRRSGLLMARRDSARWPVGARVRERGLLQLCHQLLEQGYRGRRAPVRSEDVVG